MASDEGSVWVTDPCCQVSAIWADSHSAVLFRHPNRGEVSRLLRERRSVLGSSSAVQRYFVRVGDLEGEKAAANG